MSETYTIGELAQAVAGGNETAIRKLLNDAGATPRLAEDKSDPGETVARETVIALYAQRAGDRVGRVLGGLLREEG